MTGALTALRRLLRRHRPAVDRSVLRAGGDPYRPASVRPRVWVALG